jgi:ATP-dependent Clp protease ATP-binding subunit ClpA
MYPLEKTTKNFQKVFEIAGLTAATLNTQFIGSEHFIYAFLSVPECEAHKILVAQGVGKDEYGALFVKSVDKSYTTPGMTPRTRQVYDKAGEAAERDGLTLGTAHMLQQILNIECVGVQFLRKFADIEKLKEETKRALHVVKMKKEWGEPTEEESTAYSPFGGGSASLDEAISQLEEIESPSVMTEERKDTKGKRKYSRKESDKLEGCGISVSALNGSNSA